MIQLPLNIDYTGKVVVVTGAGGLIYFDHLSQHDAAPFIYNNHS